MGLGYLSHWIISLAVDKKLRPLCLLVFQAVFYYTWKERNSRLHNNIHKPAHSLIKEIHLQVRARLLGLDRETLTKTASSHHLSSNTRLQSKPSMLSPKLASFQFLFSNMGIVLSLVTKNFSVGN